MTPAQPRAHQPCLVRAFLKAPSPHLLDLFRSLAAANKVQLRLHFREKAYVEKPWGYSTDGVESEIIGWSALPKEDRRQALQRLAALPTDVWIFGDSLWDRPNAALRKLIRGRIPAVFLTEAFAPMLERTGEAGWIDRTVIPPLKRSVVKLALRRYDAIAGIGQWACEQAAQMAPRVPRFRTHYVVDLRALAEIERPRPDQETLRFGYCGNLVPAKGVEAFFRNVLPQLRGHSHWELLLAGDGVSRDKLEQSTHQAGLADRVHFLGFLPAEELRERFWRNIDVLVFPTTYDGWGMVVTEAMAAGVPVLSTHDVGAAREYIVDGVNGWRRELAEFGPLMKQLLQTRGLVQPAGTAARASLAGYTPENVAQQLAADLTKLAETR